MALALEYVPGQYSTQVASVVATSQVGEALTLILCMHQLATQEGVYWVILDSKSAVGALCTYQESRHCGDGIHHLYEHTVAATCLAPKAAINIVVTPSHWIPEINV